MAEINAIPSNLKTLKKDELIGLVKQLDKERNELRAQLQKRKAEDELQEKPAAKKSKSTTAATSTASASASAEPATPPFDVKAKRKLISRTITRFVKKTGHSERKKPWHEVTDSLPSREVALQLLEGFEPISETSALMKWELFGNDTIVNWLGMKEPYIHPVKYDGTGLFLFAAGTRPIVKAWAAFQRANIKYNKRTNALEMKFQTYLKGTGNNVV